MKRRLIYLSSLTLTVVVNLTLVSAHGSEGRRWGGRNERRVKIWRGVWREHGINEGGVRQGRACLRNFKHTVLTRELTHLLLVCTWTTSTAAPRQTMCLEALLLEVWQGFHVMSSPLPLHRFPPCCFFQHDGHIRRTGKWVVVVSGRPFGVWLMVAREPHGGHVLWSPYVQAMLGTLEETGDDFFFFFFFEQTRHVEIYFSSCVCQCFRK